MSSQDPEFTPGMGEEEEGPRGDSRDSYSEAIFKAGVLNGFVAYNKLYHVLEFQYGVGDRDEHPHLSMSTYPKYTGYDTSPDM
eukprot:8959174-Pyramimonas_sp.AAC.1